LANLQGAITYDIILDMFRFYKNYLENQRVYNKKRGKAFADQHSVVNYDLAIILTKHSDYLQQLEREKAWAVDNRVTQTSSRLVSKAKPESSDDDSVDIGKMLDEW
jgi:hypothetical protein